MKKRSIKCGCGGERLMRRLHAPLRHHFLRFQGSPMDSGLSEVEATPIYFLTWGRFRAKSSAAGWCRDRRVDGLKNSTDDSLLLCFFGHGLKYLAEKVTEYVRLVPEVLA